MPAGIRFPAEYLTFLAGQSTPLRLPEMVESDVDWVKDIAEIYGAKASAKLLSQKRGDFWDPRLLRHAVPIARTWDGDPVLLVVAGRSAGHVLLTNHETYYGFFENLARLGGPRIDPDFQRIAGPILRRRGYRGGAPTTDQIVSVLLHPELDGAVRIARSFSAFLRTVQRTRAPRTTKVTAVPMDWRIGSFARDGNRLFAIGQRGEARATFKVLELTADGKWHALAPAPSEAKLQAVHGRLYLVSRRGLHAWAPGAAARELLSGNFEGIGSDGRSGVWAVGSQRFTGRGGNINCHLRLFHARDGLRFATVPTKNDGMVSVHDTCKQGLLISAFDHWEPGSYDEQLFVLGPTRKMIERTTPPDEGFEQILVTKRNTLVAALETALWRSTNGGTSWKRARGGTSSDWGDRSHLLQLSTGAVVLLRRKKLFVSRNDGATFVTVPIRFKDTVDAAVELAGELLVAAGRQLYRLPLP